ncbi:hypothetical protein ACF0H5_020544 [Mactra antiquata]
MEIVKLISFLGLFCSCFNWSELAGVTVRQLGDRLIQLKVGQVRGVKVEFTDTNLNLQSVERFSGIKYGTVYGIRGNVLRFFPTSSNTPVWGKEVKEFTQFSPVCPQDDVNYLSKLPEGSARRFLKIAEMLKKQEEDCMYLNIWSPIPGRTFFI